MLAVRDSDSGTTLRTIGQWRINDPSNVSRLIQIGKVRDAGNVLRTFYTFLKLAMSFPVSPNGVGVTYGGWPLPVTMTTLPATANVSDGVPPYTHAWAYVSGTTGITAQSPGASSTRFQYVASAYGAYNSVWRYTVTDANGIQATSTFEVDFLATPP